MFCRFILVIALAKFLTPSDVGTYGLLAASVVIGQLILGFEFYTYTQREFINLGEHNQSFVILHHALFVIFTYLASAPFLWAAFRTDILPSDLYLWFQAILLFEIFAQEVNRFLILMGHQLFASSLLFLRHGSWVIVAIFSMWYDERCRTIITVWASWSAAAATAAVIGIWFLYKKIEFTKISFDLRWLVRGLSVCSLYFIGALCFRGLFGLDRWATKYLMGSDFLGIYVVYIALGMVAISVLDPLVFSFMYPKLLRRVRAGEMTKFQSTMAELTKKTLTTLALIAITSALAALFLFPAFLDREYLDYLGIFWPLLAASMAYGLSMIPHYGLYALGEDKLILFAHVSGLALFAVGIFIFPYFINKPQVVGSSLMLGFVAIAIIKGLYFRNINFERSRIGLGLL